MTRSHEQPLTEPEAQTAYPWVVANLCAKDHIAFLMGFGETEFAVQPNGCRRLAVIPSVRLGTSAVTEDGSGTSASTRFNSAIRSWK